MPAARRALFDTNLYNPSIPGRRATMATPGRIF
jgi:hypothetical protein